MGIRLSKSKNSEQELAYHMRKRNCKVSRQVYKIIEEAYQAGYLQEFEFHTTIGWYHGLKFRHFKEKDDIFIAGIDRLNDYVCGLIQERYDAKLKAGESFASAQDPLPIREVTVEASEVRDMSTYFKMLEASPYLQIRK